MTAQPSLDEFLAEAMIESLKGQSDKRGIGVLYCRETRACPTGCGASRRTRLAGRLIERLAPSWGPEPTTRAVIDSLYAIDGETLDGRIPPLRFPRSSDRTRVSLCAVPLRFDGKAMRAPLGNTFRCASV